MQFPPRKGFGPADAFKQVTQWLQHPALNHVVKEAAQKLGIHEPPSLSKVQEVLRQAGSWLERAAEPLLHSGKISTDALRVGINATGEVFHPRWIGLPIASHAGQLEAFLSQGFAQDEGVQEELHRLILASTGAADAVVVANLPMAIQATVLGLTEAQGANTAVPMGPAVILPRAACVRIPVGGQAGTTSLHGILAPLGLHSANSATGLRVIEIGSNVDCLNDDYAKALASHPGSVVLHVSPIRGGLDRFAATEHAKKNQSMVCEIVLDGTLHDVRWDGGETPSLTRRWQDGADVLIVPTQFLMAGPPATLILGKKGAIDKIRPMVESLGAGLDRLTQAVLLAALNDEQTIEQWERTPVGAILSTPLANLENRAHRLAIQLQDTPTLERVSTKTQKCKIGTTVWQEMELPSAILEVIPRGQSVASLHEALAQNHPPIWTNVYSDHLEIVLRTVDPADDVQLVHALVSPSGKDSRNETKPSNAS
jgi:L-seryl-tRNA(Ser) seleniumtransferase